MNNSYLIKERSKYFDSDSNGLYCVGNKNLCAHFEDDGAIRIPWDEAPDKKEFLSIEKIYLLPTRSQVAKATVPSYLKELRNLRFVCLPSPFIGRLKVTDLPDSVNSLMINCMDDYPVTKGMTWPDLTLSNVNGLMFLGDYEPALRWIEWRLTPEQVPGLKYLKTYVDKKGEVLNEIQKFGSLSHLEIEMVYDHDIAGKISSALTILDISVASVKFSVSNISNIKTLKSLRLRSVKGEIDCDTFTALPDLTELQILNSKKIINVESLLSCQRLKSVSFVNCGNPIKNETKVKFEHAGFENLDIKYA